MSRTLRIICCAAALAALSLPALSCAGEGQARPRTEFVQTFHDIQARVFNAGDADLSGEFLYARGEDGLYGFKRDVQTGKLTFVGNFGGRLHAGFSIRFAGGRLYAVSNGNMRLDWKGLTWYKIDAQTGKPTREGVVDCPPCQGMVTGPGQKDLYLRTFGAQDEKVLWYRLGADGKPEKAGETGGKGLRGGILTAAPDGKNLYNISTENHAIACIERRAGSEIAYRKTVELEQVARRDPNGYRYQWCGIAVSPDGKWLYAHLWNGKRSENVYGIFRRSPDTGDLTLQETVSGEKDALANMRGWTVAFTADGTGGYLGSWPGPLMTFKYDPATGHLLDPAPVKETRGYSSACVLLDAANGFLYGCGPIDDYTNKDGLFVLKVDKKGAVK